MHPLAIRFPCWPKNLERNFLQIMIRETEKGTVLILAPKWMQKTGLEWLYRLPREPKKTIYRMSLVPEFLLRTLIQLISKK
jgi:hypothetical protein